MKVCWEDCLEDSAGSNALPHLPVSLLPCMVLPDPLGPAPEVPARPSPILAHLPVLTAAEPGVPGACLQGSALTPSPGARAGDLAGLSAVPKPGSSLSYR